MEDQKKLMLLFSLLLIFISMCWFAITNKKVLENKQLKFSENYNNYDDDDDTFVNFNNYEDKSNYNLNSKERYLAYNLLDNYENYEGYNENEHIDKNEYFTGNNDNINNEGDEDEEDDDDEEESFQNVDDDGEDDGEDNGEDNGEDDGEDDSVDDENNVESFSDFDKQNSIKLFYADWCPHCKEIKPSFENELPIFLEKNNLKCKVELINSDRDKELVKKYNIRGYPTIIFESNKNDRREYGGPRNVRNIALFVKESLYNA